VRKLVIQSRLKVMALLLMHRYPGGIADV